ncbi:MAG: undecaprenyldiphospho-muramoylpentapeptide beta-N-acetylglucosaminyltransferase [Pseudomonadota bacterium]
MAKHERARTILLAAGGTGGHLFPAFALAEELSHRGYAVDLATDTRGDRYGTDFPARKVHPISSATFAGKSPVALAQTGWTLAKGLRQANALLGEVGPGAVLGFGGYPSFPPLMAAVLRGIPTAIHEQNAVLGRANRTLAGRVTAIATSFDTVKYTEGIDASKVVLTGNPVRSAVRTASTIPYPVIWADGDVRIVVFGGSQGARLFSDLMPDVLAAMPPDILPRLHITQQCREEDLDRVQAAYAQLGISMECATFFRDLPERIAGSHLVIGRSGASTVAELAAIGRPSILVPLPHSVDNDQLLNATRLVEAGAAWCIEQSELSPARLAEDLTVLIDAPDQLTGAAKAAQALGRPDADQRLADLVEHLASRSA